MIKYEVRGLLRWRHVVASVVHYSAFAFLLGYAIDRSDNELSIYANQFWITHNKFDFSPRRWLYNCYVNSTFVNTTVCDDDDKRFYVEVPAHKTKVNILFWASSYVLWSATLHAVAAWVPQWSRDLRWADYTFTAPTMLFVVSLAFGADSVTTLIFPPIVLALLMVGSWLCEQQTTFTQYPNDTLKNAVFALQHAVTNADPQETESFTPFWRMATRRKVFITGLYVVFGACVVPPVLWTSYELTVEQPKLNQTTGVGTAPNYVFIFSAVTKVLFLTFGILFAVNLFKEIDREKFYIYLSMIAKTTLHLFLGLAVIQQSNVVGVGKANPDADGMDTVRNGLIGAGGLVLGLGVLMLLIGPAFRWYHGISTSVAAPYLSMLWLD